MKYTCPTNKINQAPPMIPISAHAKAEQIVLASPETLIVPSFD
jgi:hypothetical protein